MSETANKLLHRLQQFALPTGIVALLLCIALGAIPSFHATFFNAYLFAWLFWLGISLGGMALTMLHYLTGGDWGVLIRPINFSAARVMPLMLILSIPICFGLKTLFPWANADNLAHDAILAHQSAYLNPNQFFIRLIIYFAIWCGLVAALTVTPPTMPSALRRISAGGMVLYVVTMTAAGVDWIMSRQPHWSSTVFGFVTVISQTFTALSFSIVILRLRINRPNIHRYAQPSHFIDLGNLMLTLVILWAYMNFSQFLVTWTGNERDDVGWYVARTYGGWRVVAGIIVFVHFLVPLIMLMFRSLKGDIRRLGLFCAAIFVLRILDLYWNVGPLGHDIHYGFTLSPLDVLAWLGIGGLWFATFSWFLNRTPDLALEIKQEQENYGSDAPQSA